MMTPQATVPADILLVEDSPSDVLFTREALAQARVLANLHVVEDGVRALEFLRRVGPYSSAPHPHLILLDLNLPRKDGRELLREIKEDPALRMIPVAVLTTSSREQDVLRAYDLHANCYITKPVDFGRFVELVRSLDHFWFSVVTLPPRPSDE